MSEPPKVKVTRRSGNPMIHKHRWVGPREIELYKTHTHRILLSQSQLDRIEAGETIEVKSKVGFFFVPHRHRVKITKI